MRTRRRCQPLITRRKLKTCQNTEDIILLLLNDRPLWYLAVDRTRGHVYVLVCVCVCVGGGGVVGEVISSKRMTNHSHNP